MNAPTDSVLDERTLVEALAAAQDARTSNDDHLYRPARTLQQWYRDRRSPAPTPDA